MSNSVGLMLSFIFLALFIVFSGELIAYQTKTAQSLNITNTLAVHIEKYGYDAQEFNSLNEVDYFDSVLVFKQNQDDCVVYEIHTMKKYESFSEFFSFMNQSIRCRVYVTLKE